MNMFWIYLNRFMNIIVWPPQAKIPSSATTLTCCAGHRALPWEAPILSYFGPWETHVYLSMAYGKENPWPLLALSICSHHSSFSNISLSLSLSLSRRRSCTIVSCPPGFASTNMVLPSIPIHQAFSCTIKENIHWSY